MDLFLVKLTWLLWGAVIGWFAHPIWIAAKKIIQQAKQAKKEWQK
jgi:hypothetical protein